MSVACGPLGSMSNRPQKQPVILAQSNVYAISIVNSSFRLRDLDPIIAD
jgi:hypothetical protein